MSITQLDQLRRQAVVAAAAGDERVMQMAVDLRWNMKDCSPMVKISRGGALEVIAALGQYLNNSHCPTCGKELT